MQVGVKKCDFVAMKRGKLAKSTDIERSGGGKIREMVIRDISVLWN